jgi:hypothetical protein
VQHLYKDLQNPTKAFYRDVNMLIALRAVAYTKNENIYNMFVRLEWATEITESEFFQHSRDLPKAKSHSFL